MFTFLNGYVTHIAGFAAMFTGLGMILSGLVTIIHGDNSGQDQMAKGFAMFLGGMAASGLRRAISNVQKGGTK